MFTSKSIYSRNFINKVWVGVLVKMFLFSLVTIYHSPLLMRVIVIDMPLNETVVVFYHR